MSDFYNSVANESFVEGDLTVDGDVIADNFVKTDGTPFGGGISGPSVTQIGYTPTWDTTDGTSLGPGLDPTNLPTLSVEGQVILNRSGDLEPAGSYDVVAETGLPVVAVNNIKQVGNILFAASFGGLRGLIAIDMTQPDSLKVIGSYSSARPIIVFSIVGKYAYMRGSGGLHIVDISDPSNMTQAAVVNITQPINVIGSGNNKLYLFDNTTAYIMSLRDPLNPTEEAQFSSVNTTLIKADTNYLYINRAAGALLEIYDLNTSTYVLQNYIPPTFVGTDTFSRNYFIQGGIMYMYSNPTGLWIIDISDPSSPVVLSFTSLPQTFSTINKLYVEGDYAYIIDQDTGLFYSIDITEKTTPFVSSQLLTVPSGTISKFIVTNSRVVLFSNGAPTLYIKSQKQKETKVRTIETGAITAGMVEVKRDLVVDGKLISKNTITAVGSIISAEDISANGNMIATDFLKSDGSAIGGGVSGPITSTDTAIAVYDGVLGDTIKNSNITIDGSGNLTMTGNLSTPFIVPPGNVRLGSQTGQVDIQTNPGNPINIIATGGDINLNGAKTIVQTNLDVGTSTNTVNISGGKITAPSGIDNLTTTSAVGVNVGLSLAPTLGQVLTATSSSAATWQTPPVGVSGPVTSTDTAIAVYDGVTGNVIKNSLVTIDGVGKITAPSSSITDTTSSTSPTTGALIIAGGVGVNTDLNVGDNVTLSSNATLVKKQEYNYVTGGAGDFRLVTDCFVIGDIMYAAVLADGTVSDGIVATDISRPNAMKFVGTLFNGQTSFLVATVGKYIYLKGSGGGTLDIIDITRPDNMVFAAQSVATSGGSNSYVYGKNNRLYLSSPNNLFVYSLSNPILPSLIATVTTNNSTTFVKGDTNDGYFYGGDSTGNICIVDLITNTQTFPNYLPTGATPNNKCSGLVVQGTILYYYQSTTGLYLVDVSDADIPVTLGSYSMTGGSNSDLGSRLTVNGDYVYILPDVTPPVIHVIDTSDKINPTGVSVPIILDDGNSGSITIQGNYLYVLTNNPGAVDEMSVSSFELRHVNARALTSGSITCGTIASKRDASIDGEIIGGKGLTLTDGIFSGGDIYTAGDASCTDLDVRGNIVTGGAGGTPTFFGTFNDTFLNGGVGLLTNKTLVINSIKPVGATGLSNVFINAGSINSVTSAARNVVIGTSDVISLTSGNENIIIGHDAGANVSTANDNIYIGNQAALGGNGLRNTAIGSLSGLGGISNVSNLSQDCLCIGYAAGRSGVPSSSRCVFLGNDTGTNATLPEQVVIGNDARGGGRNNIVIGYNAIGTADNQCMIGSQLMSEIVPHASATCNLGSATNPFDNLTLNNALNNAVTTINTVIQDTKIDAYGMINAFAQYTANVPTSVVQVVPTTFVTLPSIGNQTVKNLNMTIATIGAGIVVAESGEYELTYSVTAAGDQDNVWFTYAIRTGVVNTTELPESYSSQFKLRDRFETTSKTIIRTCTAGEALNMSVVADVAGDSIEIIQWCLTAKRLRGNDT